MDSLNSFGNLETVPPHAIGATSYPFGRVIRGQTPTFYPDKTFERMIESQGQQPPIYIDTSWLLVGHVDETLSFVKAATPRGWKLLVNDARLAKKMLEDQVAAGNGAITMFQGKQWDDENDPNVHTPAEASISAVLADTNVMQASAEAAVEVDAQLVILKKELALGDDEIISVPFLHHTIDGASAAYQPGMVNGISISDTHFGAPDPHGPIINGKDIFKDAFTQALAPLGITVDYIEDWDEYHVGIGEVHCGTNSSRAIPDAKWWESGR
jgi:protein-arginine deiminase